MVFVHELGRGKLHYPARLKVLLHSFDFPPNDGGIARFCDELATGFRRAGDQVQVVSQIYPDAVSANDVTRVRADRPRRELDALRELRAIKSDLAISGIWYPEGLLTAMAGHKRTVILAHGSELMPTTDRWRRGIWNIMKRRVLESASLVVANSEWTARLVKSVAPAARVIAIPLGVDVERFCPGDAEEARRHLGVEGKLVLASVSRLHQYKGHDVVLDALASLPPATWERFVYLIAGRGPARQPLEERAKRLGIADQIRWLGFAPDAEIVRLYRAANLFVLCTRELHDSQEAEGFGLVFLEAQACGTPVLGTNTGGIPDAVKHGEGGWLVPPDDPAAVANILADLAANQELFQRAGSAARQRVLRECTWASYFARLSEVLRASDNAK